MICVISWKLESALKLILSQNLPKSTSVSRQDRFAFAVELSVVGLTLALVYRYTSTVHPGLSQWTLTAGEWFRSTAVLGVGGHRRTTGQRAVVGDQTVELEWWVTLFGWKIEAIVLYK